MFKNYLKTAFRNLRKEKVYSIITVCSLSVGLSCCFLIMNYVSHEMSFDKYHTNAENIYRIAVEVIYENEAEAGQDHTASTPAPLGIEIRNNFPEVIDVVRMHVPFTMEKFLVSCGDKQLYEEKLLIADSSILNVFTFPFLIGDPETVLNDPESIVITERMAHKLVGESNPLGKTVCLENKHVLKITGVLKDIPANSHFSFDILVPFSFTEELFPYWNLEGWGQWNYKTYILLHEGSSPFDVERKINDYFSSRLNRNQSQRRLYLQPLTRIHLHSHIRGEFEANNTVRTLYFMVLVALGLLVVACTNFINLFIAKSGKRAKEIGIRKTVGATRSKLFNQFMFESIFIAIIAFLFALVLVELFQPAFSLIIGKGISISYFTDWLLSAGMLGITICVGIISGCYLAVHLSKFSPVKVLKNQFSSAPNKFTLRNVLIILQFGITLFFVMGTFIVHNQLHYIESKNLGFDKEHIINLNLYNSELKEKYRLLKNEVSSFSKVKGVTGSSYSPLGGKWRSQFWWEGAREDEVKTLNTMYVDCDFLDVFDIELKEGRNFSPEISSDIKNAVILNEAAVQDFGWESAVGKKFDNETTFVIGVVKDFHFHSLHSEVEPLVIRLGDGKITYDYLSVRVGADNMKNTLAYLESEWRNLAADYPFEYSFLDGDLDRLYRSERNNRKLFTSISLLALFISSLGIFGLVSFVVERRKKEIGIRKVLGATILNISGLISWQFIKLVLLSNLISWPISYYFLSHWLQNFAYRTSISLWAFLFSGLLVCAVALIAINSKSIKIAVANPVDSIRYE